MNELLQPEFEVLLDFVPEANRPQIAVLMETVEQYEDGDFSRAIDYLDLFSSIRKHLDEEVFRVLTALMRIVRYCAELSRVQANAGRLDT